MARASRSKTQPAFDPGELKDLIFTAAVGSGVGSHLVIPPSSSVNPSTDETTVDRLLLTTVVESTESSHNKEVTIGSSHPPNLLLPEDDSQTETVDGFNLSTVDSSNKTTVASQRSSIRQAVLGQDESTQSSPSLTRETGTRAAPPTVPYSRTPVSPIWITEEGELVPGSRVKRIRFAQDVLNSAEESVYDTLWAAGGMRDRDKESFRIVQAGYDFLMKRTRLSKKTIQRIIDRLILKDFIVIEQPADIYRRTSTVYRIFSYRAVLDRQAQKGRLHVVKIGPGFLYVNPIQDPRQQVGLVGEVKTAPQSPPPTNLTTVVSLDKTTGVGPTTPTGVAPNQTTVVPLTTLKIEQRNLGTSSSSSPQVRELKGLLQRDLGLIDDDAVEQLLKSCRIREADCTLEEIAYLVSHKLRLVRNIQNPVGFILTAVPRHFENKSHIPVRELLRKEAEETQQQWQEAYDYWKQLSEDLTQSETDRREARKMLASLDKAEEGP